MIVNLAPDLLKLENVPGKLTYRHPDYVKKWWWREFGRVSYIGGREYLRPIRLGVDFWEPVIQGVDPNQPNTGSISVQQRSYPSLLFRFAREKEFEYFGRQQRAYYQNFVRTVDNMLVSHAMKQGVTRQGDPLLTLFWGGVDAARTQSMDAFMKSGMRWANVEELMWACVDVREPKDGGDGKPYVYWVSPLDVLDWELDEYGALMWLKQFVYTETARDSWKDKSTAVYRFRIWYRDRVETWETTSGGSNEELVETKPYGINRVPFVPLYSMRDEDGTFTDGIALLADFCKGCNDVFNKTSLLSEILYKQTFSWLIIPDKNASILQTGVNTALGWDASQANGAKPEYISPDPEQARVMMESIASTIEQLRQSVGVGRGRQEGSMQKSSGDALELESEDKRSILSDMATSAQDFEIRLADMVSSYRTAKPAAKPHIQYPTEFDVRALKADIDEALSFRSLSVSPEVSFELVSQLIRRKFGSMPAAELDALIATQKKVAEEPPAPAEPNATDGKPPLPGDKKPPFAPANPAA